MVALMSSEWLEWELCQEHTVFGDSFCVVYKCNMVVNDALITFHVVWLNGHVEAILNQCIYESLPM